MALPKSDIFPNGVLGAIKNINYDGTPEDYETTNQVFSYTESVLRAIGAWGLLDVVHSLSQPETPRAWMIWIIPANITGATVTEANAKMYDPNTSTFVDITPDLFVTMIISKAMSDSALMPNATKDVRGLMSDLDKKKLNEIESGANKYTHPTGNGNKHIPSIAISDVGKVLLAVDNQGTTQWGKLPATMVQTNSDYQFISAAKLQALDQLILNANIRVAGDIELI